MKKFFLYGLVAFISLSAGIGFHLYSDKIFKGADFRTINGENHSWTDFQGDWVVINYFAEWCAPCLKEVPELNQFNSDYNIPLFAISFDGEPDERMHQLAAKYGMEFSIISAQPQPELPVSRPRALPTTYIVDPQGQVAKTIQGEVTHQKLFATIEALKRSN